MCEPSQGADGAGFADIKMLLQRVTGWVVMRRAVIIVVLVLAGALLAGLYYIWTPDKSRAGLEAKYLHSPGDYLDVAGIRLHLRDSGTRNAPTVILLHGFGSSLQTWDAWADVLSSHYRVVRFDLPGSGLTGPDPTTDYSDGRSVQIITALMDRLHLARASLVGNSIGGRIAWKFAALEPKRVEKLVLISPDGFASPGFHYGKKPQVPVMLNLMRYALPKALLRMNLAPAYGDPAYLTDAVVTRYYDLMLAPGVRGAMMARMQQTILAEPKPFLARIQAPTLLLWGEKDHMIPFANARDYMQDLPHAILHPLPGLGHVPQEEAPAVSLAPVISFLAQ
jgi:pimeloyl-ACP methyl ester carboxylesterase